MNNILKSDLTIGLFVLLFIIVIAFGSFYQNKPPRVVTKDAPAELFSAERAMAHLPYICAKPHSIGTTEHLRVRNYLIDVLKSMGLTPELQIAEVYYPDSYRAATIGNIIVKIPGTNNTKSVLVMGHYDSVDDSYGASDDGSAIVTMLETLRVLKTQDPLMNDIIFLFTDGEESGLLGARAFLEQHPLAKDIGLVLNFEASGTSGQSMLFETSKDNRWIISEFAKAAPYPVANSMNYEVYRNMPNSTDLTPFKDQGYKCLNFAFLENRYDYHTCGDNIANTNPSSIQHQGYYATDLTKHFGNIDLNNSIKGNAVFFNTVGNGFVHYSYKLILPFVILTVIIFLLVLIIGFKRKIIKPLRMLLGFVAFIIHLAIAPAIITCIYFVLAKYYQGSDSRLLYYNYIFLLLSFVCVTAAISFVYFKLLQKGIRLWQVLTFVIIMLILLFWSGKISIMTSLITLMVSALIYLLFRKSTSVWELSVGSAIGWIILMISVSLMLPGVSYLFTWPLLFFLIPVGISFLHKNRNKFSLLQIGLFLIFSIPSILWFSNLTYLFLAAMGLSMAGAAVLFTVLCLSLLVPHIDIITRARPWAIPIVAVFLGIIFFLKGSVSLDYSERYKKSNSIIYAVNGDTKETFWTSLDGKTDVWTENFLSDKPDKGKMSEFFPFENRDFLKKNIETSLLPSPEITVLNDSIQNKDRLLKLHLISGRKANYLDILIKTDSKVVRAGINKSEMTDLKKYKETDWQYIRYCNIPANGIEMNLQFESDKKVEIHLIDIVIGLPDFLPSKPIQRPDYMMSKGDRSLIAKSFIY